MNQRYISKDLENILYKKFQNYSENSGSYAWFVVYLAIFKKYEINKQEYLINYSVEQLLLEFTYFKEHDILSKEEMDRLENSLQHLQNLPDFEVNQWK